MLKGKAPLVPDVRRYNRLWVSSLSVMSSCWWLQREEFRVVFRGDPSCSSLQFSESAQVSLASSSSAPCFASSCSRKWHQVFYLWLLYARLFFMLAPKLQQLWVADHLLAFSVSDLPFLQLFFFFFSSYCARSRLKRLVVGQLFSECKRTGEMQKSRMSSIAETKQAPKRKKTYKTKWYYAFRTMKSSELLLTLDRQFFF